MSTLKSSAEDLTLNADGANNDVIIQSNGSTVGTVDCSAGSVGIGTTTPTALSNYAALSVNDSTGGLIEIMVGGTRTANIQSSASLCNIQTRTNIPIAFDINSSEKMRLTGDGLTFNGDTAAANALDDYEEGTWTPTLPNGGTVGTITNTYYTKIGRQVHAVCFFAMSSIPSDGLEFRIGGLPFATPTSHYGPGSIAYMGAFDGLGIGMTNGFVAHDNSYIYFKRFDGTSVSVLNSSVTSLATIIIGVTYCTAT